MSEVPLLLLLGIPVIGLVPIIIGITLGVLSRKFRIRTKSLITGIAFGAMIFSMLDLFRGALGLGVDFGFSSPATQVILLLSFALGLYLPTLLDRHSEVGSLLYPFAIVIGFHSFGEGIVIGYDFPIGYGFPLLDRGLQTLSFMLHKGAEGLAISIPVMLSKSIPKRQLVYAILISAGPLFLGTALVSAGADGSLVSFSFAAGLGGLTFMLLRLGKILGDRKETDLIYLGLLVGVLYLYLAGAIHGV
ncbi:MAG: hypothetical protein ACE5KG_02280 [Nitrososphaerales archaeon]